MSKRTFIVGFAVSLLINTICSAQQTQTGPPAQPTPSIYNRMRRLPPQNQQGNQPQQTTQTQQFPGQQFPPEQSAGSGQRPPMNFPHAAAGPVQQPPEQAPQPATGAITQAKPQSQPQEPYGLALQPANPPRISYAAGQLTVNADNSSLSEILNSITRTLGAHLEGTRPDSERVFGQFGPGSPRDVVNALLTGSPYDYILTGSIKDPGGVDKIVLSPHGSTAGLATAANQPRQTPQQAEEEEEKNEVVVAPQPIVEPPQPPAQTGTTSEPNPPVQQQVKTPEQLLQELQRLRQQQQQQQNPR